MVPESVIIIGGSVAGLLQGLQLKRHGSNVTVLEQDPSKDRHSHESGVSIGPSVMALLDRYDATGRPAAIPTEFMSAAWRRRLRVANIRSAHNMSNWGCLYLILRANFDGLASAAVPKPPAPRPGDGAVQYRPGQKVTGVRYDRAQGLVHVSFVDVTTGAVGEVSARQVIAADGVHSTVRQLLQVPTRKEYAGYIAWRGTVPEKLLSPQTVEYFFNRLNFTLLRGTYFISYLIPTESGHVEPGNRLLNWVWYFFVPEGSPEMQLIFTDIHGKVHTNTVPRGLVNPAVWQAQLARYLPQMTAPLAEAVSLTSRVFVTKVGEAQCTTPSIFDGRLVLVGDAFTGFRSHLGKASEQAAQHSLQMDRVWRGEITQAERDREANYYAQRMILLNRLMGFLGLGLWWAVLRTGFEFLALVLSARLGWA
ncbi:FAD binding domain protein [Aspergillus clavatus NRRL 1]|uniref:FAD binding domain protein n=1 Tax=Aspergillus clavatus (strain ATCC 1007 / CBS 513.65 / DSM 816 / NCTC 3887 / NRRL 1 / QM 1276 / 107) TaxID=344612 RepID=A1C9G6_ASPCL|nr:FAD binding domain protein [Aspergillus clavatus NRRL 1]EAW13490.1 FAD binding domain protein [Aspergillus clavatus NRRL 1]